MSERKIFRLLALVLIFSLGLTSVPGLFVSTPAYAINEKLTTAIVSVDCPTENNLPVRINTALSAAMVKSHRFEVTDKDQVASTLKDMQLAGKKLNITQACEVGKALGVETVTIVSGYGIESNNEKCYITISVQVVDVSTGIVVQSAFQKGEGYKGEKFELTDEAVNNSCQGIVNRINDNMSKVGLIATIKDGIMDINIGGDLGIQDESEFAVYREKRVIGRVKIRQLGSYEASVDKIMILPGLNFQEGDIVVVSSNQGKELYAVQSPGTLEVARVSPGVILASVIVGTALAIIATNQSSQIQQLAYVYRFQAHLIRHEGNAAVYLATVQVTDHNGQIVPDGTTVTFHKQTSGTGDDVNVIGFGNAVAIQEDVQTFGGIASTTVYIRTGAALNAAPGIFIRSEGRNSPVYLFSLTDPALVNVSGSIDVNAHVANGQDAATITATITPPTGTTVSGGLPVVFQVIQGNALFSNGKAQFTGYTTAGINTVTASLVSSVVGTSLVAIQFQDQQTQVSVTFGQAGIKVPTWTTAITAPGPGVTTQATLTVKDSKDLPISGATVTLQLIGTGLSASPNPGTTDSNGNASFLFTNTLAHATPALTSTVLVTATVSAPAPYNQAGTVNVPGVTVILTGP